MIFLIVGLGSMGKRRIRCLKHLGYQEIYGFDLREDRREEASSKYGIKTFADYENALSKVKPEVLIISVPPDVHHLYMKSAIKNNLHFFVEASVIDTDFEKIKASIQNTDIVCAPSSTMTFHPAIQKIMEIVRSGELGKLSNFIFHSGQYLPDWHIYESVSDFYVSNPLTGGAREITPFELTWLTHLFGFPKRVSGNVRKTINIKGAEKIDDTYNFLLDYEEFLGTVTIDIVSRHATRRLLINGDQKQLIWNWEDDFIKVYDPENKQWSQIHYTMMRAEEGYHQNIGENMYIDEIHAFIEAIQKKQSFMNNLDNDHRVLKLLYTVERSSNESKILEFDS